MANIRGVFHWVLPALWVTTSFAHLSRHSIVFIQRMTKLATRWRATCNRNASNLNQTSLKSQDHQDISRPSRPRKRRETSGNVTTLGTTLCRPQFPKSSPQAVKLAVMLDTWCWHCQHTETESTETTSNSTRRVRPSHTLDLDILDLDLANSLLWPKKFGHVIPVIPSHAR